MAYAVGIAVGDGPEYGFRPVGFSGVDGLLQEVGVAVLECGAVVICRVPRLGAGEVEPDYRQALFVGQAHRGAGQFGGRGGEDLLR